jgi:MSHA pilin protein MshD
MCTTEPRIVAQFRQSGLSMVELIFAIVIISVGLVALLIPLTGVTRRSGNPIVNKQMIAIAEAMLEEIELKPFANPTGGFTGAATQANRPQFDDVSDYNTFTSAGAGIFTIDGSAVPGLGGYNVAVTVVPTAVGGIAVANAKLITVTVTAPDGHATAVSAFRSNYF